MLLQNRFKLISGLLYLLFTVSMLQGQSCEEQVEQINIQVQDIIEGVGESNIIYDTYSATDSCVWAEDDWSGKVDFSGVAFDVNQAGTLVSPRHILMATHYQRAVGSVLTFHDSLGVIHNATLISKGSMPGGTNPDITVGLLDVDVPVKYYRVLPPQNNWGSCLDGALAISTHHNRNASIREVSSASGSYISFSQSAAVPTSYYAPVIGGNSGNPIFLIINDEPILISTFTFGGGGTGPFFSTPTNFNGIDSLMTLLGGGYQLETNGIDEDGDGFYDYEDCDDNNAEINPDQTEIEFNGIDDDCDPGTLDHDEDGDGFSIDDDCNDQDPDIYPGAVEILNNNIDEDCDGLIDENDMDNDGYVFEDDCDDNNPYINPDAVEIPNNEIDENCDGELLQIEACETAATGPYSTFLNVGDDCETPFAANFEVWTNESYNLRNLDEEKTYYFDFCEGYDPEVWEALITVMAANISTNELGYIITAKADCRIEFQFSYQEEFPDVVVIVSNRNDCAGATEQVNNGVPTFGCLIPPPDLDGDGFTADVDCDDNDSSINPSAIEVIYNGLDDDCNPLTLDDDLDQDGFIMAEDCDDNNAEVNPDKIEIAYNGIDDDCDPTTLDDDLDQDGFLLVEDCDDNNADINPNQTEIVYNGIDDDCDPTTLDDDLDQDGFLLVEDCDDNNADINSNQNEIAYNGIDDDCNPVTLDDDLDEDGYVLADDCDDINAEVNPGADEVVYNGIDDDCDPMTLDDDLDQDGFVLAEDCDDNNVNVNPDSDEVVYNGFDDDCDPTTLDDDLDQDMFELADDCDDTNANINPDAVEIADNGIDEDCDGSDLITSIDELDQFQISLFPNPTESFIHVKINGVSDFKIQILDYTGQLIYTSENTYLIDVSEYAAGVYFVKIFTDLNDDKGIWQQKVIIQ